MDLVSRINEFDLDKNNSFITSIPKIFEKQGFKLYSELINLVFNDNRGEYLAKIVNNMSNVGTEIVQELVMQIESICNCLKTDNKS